MSTSIKYRVRRAEDATFRTAIQRVMALMSSRDRRRLWYLIPVASLNALVQVAGIASVMPFLALVANPQFVREQAQLAWVYDTLGFRSPDALVIFAGFAALAALVLTNVVAAGTQLMMLNFSWSLNHSLSTSMLRTYLAKPYVFFLNQNTAGLTKNILGEVKQMVNGFVIAGLNLIAGSVVVIAILGLLLVLEPLLALSTFALLGTAYGSVFAMVQRGILKAGRHRSAADRARFKAVTEALTGIKAIKLQGMENAFVRHYETPSKVYARYMARQQVIGFLPRYALETIAFGGLLLIVLFQLMRGSGVSDFLPTLGVFALAAYRLLPALQGIFASLTDLRFSVASIELLFNDLEPRVKVRSPQDAVAPVRLGAGLELRNVTFSYPNARQPVLEDFSLRIAANTTVAFVGTTGAGKTTVVDLILGLLRPQSGSLLVDGVPVGDDGLSAWQMSLGYVPQDIYLADDTVSANIAFGVPPDDIDIAAVERAARLASIHDFITEELPSGYATEVGDRGVRLSGGQRQRLGIARALFHDPSVLILDEATSALDSVTEESIFHSVHEIGRSKTVVMIAHRISTVQKCDVIFVLDRGRVVASGSYRELLAISPEFRALAK